MTTFLVYARSLYDVTFGGELDADHVFCETCIHLTYKNRPECTLLIEGNRVLIEGLFIAPKALPGQRWRLVDDAAERRRSWAIILSMPIGTLIGLLAAIAGGW